MEMAHFGFIESNSNFASKLAVCNSFHDHKILCMLQYATHSCSPSSNICITEVLFCYWKHRSHSVNVDGPMVQVLLKIYRIGGMTIGPRGRIYKQLEWENRRHWKRQHGRWGGSRGCTCRSRWCCCLIEVKRSTTPTDWINEDVYFCCLQQSAGILRSGPAWCTNLVGFGAHLQEYNNWEAEKTTTLHDLLYLKMPRKAKEPKKKVSH
jgi:hypothetical protein